VEDEKTLSASKMKFMRALGYTTRRTLLHGVSTLHTLLNHE